MPELDRQKALEACRECFANRHKRILQHCRTCVYGTLVNTIAQAESENNSQYLDHKDKKQCSGQ